MRYIKLFDSYKTTIDKLSGLIEDLIKQYDRGRPFFDAFDDSMRKSNNEDIIIELFKGLQDKWVITSGGFGDVIYKLWEDGKIKCLGMVVFNGKMYTKKKSVTSWYPYNFDIDNKSYVFVDDSLFTGNTYKKIDDYLKNEHNSHIDKVFVVYDGSKQKDPNVDSLFRYYDKHPINESNTKSKFVSEDIVEFLYDLSVELSDIGLYTDVKYRNLEHYKTFDIDKKDKLENLIEVRLYIEDRNNVIISRDNEDDWLVTKPIIEKIFDRLKEFGYQRGVDYKVYGGWKGVNIVFGEFSY